MASVSRKYKEAQERWIQHCHDIERSTAKIPKGTEQERKNRIARARKDYRYFVRTYFPHLATTECADFQVDAAIYMRTMKTPEACSSGRAGTPSPRIFRSCSRSG